uniref:G-protein coupled receptors family 1 profile domain-containing protein n=2 Tax=Clytia hemisphaerica TaxID=252671 RepID=A0A7M5WQV3_9CNID
MTLVTTFPVRIWQLVWYSLISLIGTIGNSLVIYLICAAKKSKIDRKAPFNIYLLVLAIVDLMISLLCVPIYVLSTNIFPHPTGKSGEIMCKTVTGYFFPFWLLDISAFLLVAIAIERWRVVMKPLTRLKENKMTWSVMVIFGVLILSFVTQAPTIYGSHYTTNTPDIGNACIYSYDNLPMKIMHYNSFVWQTVIPSIIYFVCFWQIRKRLNQRCSNLDSHLTAYRNSSNYQEKVTL